MAPGADSHGAGTGPRSPDRRTSSDNEGTHAGKEAPQRRAQGRRSNFRGRARRAQGTSAVATEKGSTPPGKQAHSLRKQSGGSMRGVPYPMEGSEKPRDDGRPIKENPQRRERGMEHREHVRRPQARRTRARGQGHRTQGRSSRASGKNGQHPGEDRVHGRRAWGRQGSRAHIQGRSRNAPAEGACLGEGGPEPGAQCTA